MNAGFSNLATLKARLLPPQSLSQTDCDGRIAAIGQGVARWFEKLCDRRFARAEGDAYLCRADRTYVVLPRYPVEAVSAVDNLATGGTLWSPATATYLLYPESGLLDFAEALGSPAAQLRVTYTGGYWWDQTEDGTGTMPAGAAPLPADLLQAWLDQCAFLFERETRLGLEKITGSGGSFTLEPTHLLPHVTAVLQGYRRQALT
ncbi:MAG: hypothetical protein PW734_06155 [Verrucomicrobium sp.]|nr:hypothetical protein [Verrucomicrobium sp.]